MIVCPACGRQSADTARFCDICGKPLPEAAAHVYDDAYVQPVKISAEQHAAEQRAQARRAEVEAQRFAAQQAREIPEPRPEDMQLMIRPQKSYKTPFIVTCIIAILLIIGLAIALGVQTFRLAQLTNYNEDRPNETTTAPRGFSSETDESPLSGKSDGNASRGQSDGSSGGGSSTLGTATTYREVLSDLISTIKAEAGTSAATVIRESNGSVADINKDGEDELMLVYSPDGKIIYASVYSQDASGSVSSMTEELGRIDDVAFAGVYSGTLGNSAIVCLVSTAEGDNGAFVCDGTMYTVKNGSIKTLHSFSCTESATDDGSSEYIVDGNKVTKSKFNEYLSALEHGECYYGTDTPGYSLIALMNLLK